MLKDPIASCLQKILARNDSLRRRKEPRGMSTFEERRFVSGITDRWDGDCVDQYYSLPGLKRTEFVLKWLAEHGTETELDLLAR